MEGFSIAANIFSVVGLADVVFRLGVDTASLYSRYSSASKDIASLVDEIQAFVGTITHIRVYLDEYRQSDYAQSDGQTPPPQLAKVLSDCETELRNLKQFADKKESKPDDGLATQVWKHLRWASQQDHVLKSRERIRHLNMNLQTVLVLIGRKNDIVLRNELKSTRADITTAGSTVHQALHSLEGTLTRKQENTNTLVQSQTTLMSQLIKQSDDHHLSLESNINSNQKAANFLVQNQTTLISQMIQQSDDHHLSLESNINSKHEQSNALVQSQTTIINHMIKESVDNLAGLLKQIPSLTLEQTDNDGFIFQGDNLGSIVLPLLLMKPPLFKTIRSLQKEGVLKVSHSEAEWILQQFDKLLAKGYGAAKKDLERRPSSTNQAQEHITEVRKVSDFYQIGRVEHTSTIYTSSGILMLQTGSSNRPIQRHQSSAELQVIRLSFFPKPELSTVNLCMLMTNDFGENLESQIPRVIQTYNTIPLESEDSDLIWRLIKEDDAKGLEDAFRLGRGSPNDIFEGPHSYGRSLSEVAIRRRSNAICEFLFREEACASMFRPYGSNGECIGLLHTIWFGVPRVTFPVLADLEDALYLSNLVIKHDGDPNMVSMPDQRNMIHTFISIDFGTRGEIENDRIDLPPFIVEQLFNNELPDIFSSMVGMGCELEGRDVFGHTPLVLACHLMRWNMIKALVGIGADVNTTADNGNGVLHILLLSKPSHNSSLLVTLGMLLANKADPNLLNDEGWSPSDYACTLPTPFNTWLTHAARNAGYTTLWTVVKHTNCGHEEKILVVVSAGFDLSGNSTLPISSMPLGEWLEKRFQRRARPDECKGYRIKDFGIETEEI